VLYHAGLLTVPRTQAADVAVDHRVILQMRKKEPALTNLYMELGSTFGQLATTNPTACAHLLGQVIDAFGADHVLWGTDSIWYCLTRSGRSRPSVASRSRRPSPPPHGYKPLTRQVKEQIFGLNAARLFNVGVAAKRTSLPKGLPHPHQDVLPRPGPVAPATVSYRLDRRLVRGQVLKYDISRSGVRSYIPTKCRISRPDPDLDAGPRF